MNQGTVLSALSVSIGFLALVTAISAYVRSVRSKRVEASVNNFLDTRRIVKERQYDLQRLAYQSSDQRWKPQMDAPTQLLARPGWMLATPVPISEVTLTYSGRPSTRWRANRDEASAILPRLPGGRRPATYSQALVELDGRRELFNGFAYRLLHVAIDEGAVAFEFGDGRYFDYLDTGEILAYEAAHAWRSGRVNFDRLRIRRLLGDPFDFESRSTSCGVVTLTLRRSAEGTGFFLHRRSPKAGDVASGQLHVVPAGEFAPSNITAHAVRNDLSLWRNIVREYAEEMLGVPDARGKGGRVIDFDNDPPFSAFRAGADAGAIECYFLGFGLDPLTWKPEILTACVFAADTFDEIFGSALLAAPVPAVDDDETEGTILMGAGATGLPFEEEQVLSYLQGDMRDAGRTCLSLAWHHRHVLGIPVTT